MDTALRQGDFAVSENGIPLVVDGSQEILQRVAIRLLVHRGSFSYDPQLGSRLYTLDKQAPDFQSQALNVVQEALNPMEQVQVQGVMATGEGLRVTVRTAYGTGSVEIPLGEEELDGSREL